MRTFLRTLGFFAGSMVLISFVFAQAPSPTSSSGTAVSDKVFSLPERGALISGEFVVIGKGKLGNLTVDGQKQSWGPVAEPVRAAFMKLNAGQHEIRVGDRKFDLFVSKDKKLPTGWEAYHFHPIPAEKDACSVCHETVQRNGETVIGASKGYLACIGCHKSVEFELKHAHPLEPIKHCSSCHIPHGSTIKGSLKAPVKKLCAECHDT